MIHPFTLVIVSAIVESCADCHTKDQAASGKNDAITNNQPK
jgi:hypothetical protein